ncbi:hypothetical protein IV203_010965 [Nitzschia inconspicua]|uniref:Uncharacterized protein n=1 Tax=Nitzschia inconspicua TaxID=303405 RepID=A0A9K3KX32_9STRA|nr:hypothetical protein IV203_010965 [Nitzschia inconspicua]
MTASSPSMAVFFASIVYSKTKRWDDAFFYAQALVNNTDSTNVPFNGSIRYTALHLGGFLQHLLPRPFSSGLAASIQLRWTDDDDIAWQQLAQAISENAATTTTTTMDTTTNNNSNNVIKIHPLARIVPYVDGPFPSWDIHYVRRPIGRRHSTSIHSVSMHSNDSSTITAVTVLLLLPSIGFGALYYLARVHVAAPTGAMVQEGTPAAVVWIMAWTQHQQQQQLHNEQQSSQDNDDDSDDHHEVENEPMNSNAAMPLLPVSAQHQQHQQRPPAAAVARNRQSTGSFVSAIMGGVVGDAFWQDASSSVQLLTPIPQQPSLADMSSAAASSSGIIFFGTTNNNDDDNNNNNNNNNTSSSLGRTLPILVTIYVLS